VSTYRFRLVNVFAGEPLLGHTSLSGNPLCVFEDARGLGEREMMALTRQFNLSETTFLLPPSNAASGADIRVRIFNPTQDRRLAEMPFAGHPTLGSAHVARLLATEAGGSERDRRVVLELPAGLVPVAADGDVWTLTAPFKGEPLLHAEPMPPAQVAALLGLQEDDLAGPPVWIDTGIEQFLVPVRTTAAVRKAAPGASAGGDWPRSRSGRRNAYVFAFTGARSEGREQVMARFFVNAPGSGLYEDPGTGSACANLGGWLWHSRGQAPASVRVEQGLEIDRPCHLLLDLAADGKIRVGGRVVEVASGVVTLPQGS
jgi:trans-2,3-dihydro-3-hydroxyanthranilate isomerase